MTDEDGRSDRDDAASSSGEVLSALLNDADEPRFEAPWQARAFALAVALSSYDADIYSWNDFQRRLVAEVGAEGDGAAGPDGTSSGGASAYTESTYYEQWLRALERVLLEEGLVDPDEVQRRVRAFADGDRDASEFVEGEHSHDHAHPHDHAHDHAEDHDRSHGTGYDHGHDHDHARGGDDR
ncbi:nitrile hydratase accessory protein [Halomarina ordinaria]|uniref:Nitrile hydratase accessory protein n=1 Tax=Halomarina ordinaria TaxID=3033939 RepID=A0ABD5UB88_9EURY|nr:nitrile hydratase accessory protein [Halomarina sp. PSRA2]